MSGLPKDLKDIIQFTSLGLGGLLLVLVIILSVCLRRIHQRVKRLERNKAQTLEQELHYASLQKLPVSSNDVTDREDGESMKDDLSTDYACIAKNKPT